MNEISVFNNEAFGQIRTITINGEPWFVGNDVARILGYTNTRDALSKRVDEDDKKDGVAIRDTIGRMQNMVVINESGIYSLVMSSKLPTAKSFKHWVTKDVLPSIRSHGGYLTPAMAEQVLTDPDTIIRLATELKQERALRVGLEHQARLNAPLIAFANNVTESENDISVGDMAKLICQSGKRMGRNRLYIALRRDGYCMKNTPAGRNIPTQYAIEHGWMRLCEYVQRVDGKVFVKRSARITGKGQLYFMELYGNK